MIRRAYKAKAMAMAMAMASSNSGSVSLKLLIDSKRQKVLFAEAGKDFVDFLFTLLSLPVGTVIRLLSESGMVGSIGKLYESVEKLDGTYLQSQLKREDLLEPKSLISGPNILKLTNKADSSAQKVLYLCNYPHGCQSCHQYITENPNETCPSCSNTMNRATTYVGKETETVKSSDVGYVKGVVTYMIMDDLEVTPMSTISSITMLNKFDIKDVGALEEKFFELTMHEGIKLLKESLQSKTVLTNVFLSKKAAN